MRPKVLVVGWADGGCVLRPVVVESLIFDAAGRMAGFLGRRGADWRWYGLADLAGVRDREVLAALAAGARPGLTGSAARGRMLRRRGAGDWES